MEDRNSFAESYRTAPCVEQEGELPPIYQSLVFNEGTEDHRLSEGKRTMLETFKRSMNSLDKIEETKAEEERLSTLLRVSQAHCFQIKEESNQSEERSAKQEDSDPEHNKSQKGCHSSSEQGCSVPAKGIQLSLIPAPSLGHSASLAAAITGAIQFLGRGVPVRKCCLNRLKVEECVLCFSQDFGLMSLQALAKAGARVYSMAGFAGVRKGVTSHNFKRYIQEDIQIDDRLGFTIVLAQRSFDLLARTPQERDIIVREIQLLNECA